MWRLRNVRDPSLNHYTKFCPPSDIKAAKYSSRGVQRRWIGRWIEGHAARAAVPLNSEALKKRRGGQTSETAVHPLGPPIRVENSAAETNARKGLAYRARAVAEIRTS